jgi:MYXO-CTERM domain-containing protein
MLKRPFTSAWVALALLAGAAGARAALVVDTGTPGGSAVGALALDGNDFYAGQFSLAEAGSVQAISTHLLGGTPGETFTVTLYADSASHLPGALLYTATASVGADGWNGIDGLSGWTLAGGSWWVGIEIGASDTLGAGSITGALLDVGAPSPLARTAFDAGNGYRASSQPLAFGLRVDVSPVPEPAAGLMALAGLAGLAALSLRRHGRAR